MFTDNGQAVTKAAHALMHANLDLIAKAMETMEPQRLLLIAEHHEKGARWSVRFTGPATGTAPSAELGLWHDEAGWLSLCAFALPVPTQH